MKLRKTESSTVTQISTREEAVQPVECSCPWIHSLACAGAGLQAHAEPHEDRSPTGHSVFVERMPNQHILQNVLPGSANIHYYYYYYYS